MNFGFILVNVLVMLALVLVANLPAAEEWVTQASPVDRLKIAALIIGGLFLICLAFASNRPLSWYPGARRNPEYRRRQVNKTQGAIDQNFQKHFGRR